MRARELISEIVRTPSWGHEKVNAPTLNSIPTSAKPFPGHPGFVYRISRQNSLGFQHGNYQVLNVISIKNKEIAGALYVQTSNLLPDTVEVADVFVYDQYQRQGLSSAMYEFMAKNLGKIIVADNNPEGGQTPQARKMWIAMQEGAKDLVVKGWVKIDTTDYYFEEDDFDRVVNAVMNLGGVWLRHDELDWVVAFDVKANPRRSELMSVIRNFLSKDVYHGPTDPEYKTGLLMMSAQRYQKYTGAV
jgi:hypothetical protein